MAQPKNLQGAKDRQDNGVCVTKNCYEVFLRDDKYFRNVNEDEIMV